MDMLTLMVEASQPGMCVRVAHRDGRGDIYYHGGCAPRSILVRRLLGAEVHVGVQVFYAESVDEHTIAAVPTAPGRRCYICQKALDKVD